jgi:uncharacterized phage protein (TIGR01671 family)
MRDYYFRGKAIRDYKKIKAGDWVYGNLVYQEFAVTKEKKMCRIIAQEMGADPIEVIPETVGQFTRLLDKDCIHIFEDDIITDKYGRKSVIKWDKKLCGFVAEFIDHHGLQIKTLLNADPMEAEYLEVIGNIYDDKELLEVKSNKNTKGEKT